MRLGETVTATFAKDSCDREILARRAWEGEGLGGEPVRDTLVEAVSQGHELEFLTDNGSTYIAHETHGIARSRGLRPINMPVGSPQSNGMSL